MVFLQFMTYKLHIRRNTSSYLYFFAFYLFSFFLYVHNIHFVRCENAFNPFAFTEVCYYRRNYLFKIYLPHQQSGDTPFSICHTSNNKIKRSEYNIEILHLYIFALYLFILFFKCIGKLYSDFKQH